MQKRFTSIAATSKNNFQLYSPVHFKLIWYVLCAVLNVLREVLNVLCAVLNVLRSVLNICAVLNVLRSVLNVLRD